MGNRRARLSKSARALIGACICTVVLSSCALPLSSRGKEHKQAITQIVEVAKNFDLGSGYIEKYCAIPFDCPANDYFLYHASATYETLNAETQCAKLFELAKALGAESWDRDLHDEDLGSAASKDLAIGQSLCPASVLSYLDTEVPNQSEGFRIRGSLAGTGEPVNYVLQTNGFTNEKNEKGFKFLISTTEDPCSVDCEDDGIS